MFRSIRLASVAVYEFVADGDCSSKGTHVRRKPYFEDAFVKSLDLIQTMPDETSEVGIGFCLESRREATWPLNVSRPNQACNPRLQPNTMTFPKRARQQAWECQGHKYQFYEEGFRIWQMDLVTGQKCIWLTTEVI
jgi:hypothetical protein